MQSVDAGTLVLHPARPLSASRFPQGASHLHPHKAGGCIRGAAAAARQSHRHWPGATSRPRPQVHSEPESPHLTGVPHPRGPALHEGGTKSRVTVSADILAERHPRDTQAPPGSALLLGWPWIKPYVTEDACASCTVRNAQAPGAEHHPAGPASAPLLCERSVPHAVPVCREGLNNHRLQWNPLTTYPGKRTLFTWIVQTVTL